MTKKLTPQTVGKPIGLPKSGGRKKGVTNKISKTDKDVRQSILISGDSPLEFLVDLFRDPDKEDELRIRAATAAAPYIHAKVAQDINLGAQEGTETKFTLEIMDYKEKDEG